MRGVEHKGRNSPTKYVCFHFIAQSRIHEPVPENECILSVIIVRRHSQNLKLTATNVQYPTGRLIEDMPGHTIANLLTEQVFPNVPVSQKGGEEKLNVRKFGIARRRTSPELPFHNSWGKELHLWGMDGVFSVLLSNPTTFRSTSQNYCLHQMVILNQKASSPSRPPSSQTVKHEH